MKILLVHNFYGSSAPSGENIVFSAEKEMLEERGHEVTLYTTNSDYIRKIGVAGSFLGAIGAPWNHVHLVRMKKILAAGEFDVMHVHNTFPLLSPAVFYAPGKRAPAAVLTLHNYRLFCCAGIPLRNNRPCTECLDRQSIWPALLHGCYRNSRVATVPMALMISLHRRLATWQKRVDAFIALTTFQAEKMILAGLPGDKVYIKPHFYSAPPTLVAWAKRRGSVLFIGRLGEEKGLTYLIQAWAQWGVNSPELVMVGDGPLKDELVKLVDAAGLGAKIHFTGQVPFSEVQQRLAHSRLLVMPSVCFEGFPMAIREAFSLGVPVAVSNLGSMPCIVNDGEDGVVFRPADADDLLVKVSSLWHDQEKLAEMAKNARTEFDKKYTAETNHTILMDIYTRALERKGVDGG
jgi:glycosyltransferase involved in cell wall biosynthesis